MKHNPRVNEVIAQIPGIAEIHPHQPEHHLQGTVMAHCDADWVEPSTPSDKTSLSR